MKDRMGIVEADITQLDVDAIVNATNTALLGGVVDGAIHRTAGPALLEECRTLDGCDTGAARITGGYDLRARYVVHTVGPVWQGGGANEEALLASCYRRCLEIAADYALATIAFPAISTGVYRFPAGRAAEIAVATVTEGLWRHPAVRQVIFVLVLPASPPTKRLFRLFDRAVPRENGLIDNIRHCCIQPHDLRGLAQPDQ